MKINKIKISIIIPTKNRHLLLKKTINFLKKRSNFFKELIVVDSSNNINHKKNFENIKKQKKNIKIFRSKPGIAYQRNLGFLKSDKKSKYIMYLDDDVIFYKNAFENILRFLNKNRNISGIGFNLIINKNKNKNNFSEKIKKLKIFDFLKIYSNVPGFVTKSGWHTKAINLKKNTKVQWLPTQAVIFRRDKINNSRFDEKFGEYSYLEDLDYSYSLSKKNDLYICSSAKYYSDNDIDRNSFEFGIKEVCNRSIFVKKHSLSTIYFFLGCFFLFIRNLFSALTNFSFKFLSRSVGNIFGILISSIK